jgi:hypothetical protein
MLRRTGLRRGRIELQRVRLRHGGWRSVERRIEQRVGQLRVQWEQLGDEQCVRVVLLGVREQHLGFYLLGIREQHLGLHLVGIREQHLGLHLVGIREQHLGLHLVGIGEQHLRLDLVGIR